MVKEIFNLQHYPRSLSELYNKMVIEKRFPKAPTDEIYVALSFLQKWSCLLKEEDRTRVDHMMEEILRWLKDFKPSPYLVSDVVEF